MPNLSGKKAQFFILTTVVIVGVFYTLSKYINPYSFVDTSKAAMGGETFFFDNVKEKAIKTVEVSAPSELESNLLKFDSLVEKTASDNGYNLVFNYTVKESEVDMSMVLMSQRQTLKASFTVPRPT